MNPFGENRTVHNTWLVILTMYNLSTWLCHERKYLMLSILIQGPKQAGININVFLEPLMEDMAKLWNEGVRMWDKYQQEYFTLYAIIFVCLHDAPGLYSIRANKREEWCMSCLCEWSSISVPYIIQKIGVHATLAVLAEKT
jgi:hypothetical protein